MTAQRVTLYARVSDDNGREGRPVDDQLRELRAWADREGHIVVAEHRDDGISASRYARGKPRPGWLAAMAVINTGQADALAVWEFSRSTRDRLMWAQTAMALSAAGASLVINGRSFDPSDADDGFSLDISAAQAVADSARISRRTCRGMASIAAAGKPHGQAHWGTRIEHDPTTGETRRVIDPPAAALVKEAVTRILAGETPTGVANDFNGRGHVTHNGRPFRGNNLLRTVAAPVMAALVVHRGAVLPGVVGEWPALVTIDQHERLQALIRDESRRTVRNGAHVSALLSGVAKCGQCGGPIGTITRTRGDSKRTVYRCRRSFCVARYADEVDDVVRAFTLARLADPGLIAELSATAGGADVAAARDEAARLRLELDAGVSAVAAGDMSVTLLAALERALQPRIDAAERLARPTHIPSVVLDVAGADAAERWESLPVPLRREVVRSLLTVKINRSERRGRRSAPLTADQLLESVQVSPR